MRFAKVFSMQAQQNQAIMAVQATQVQQTQTILAALEQGFAMKGEPTG